MIGILFWGNLASALLIFSYQAIHKTGYYRKYVRLLYFSRLMKAACYFFLFYRGIIPNIASVNLGNSLMYAGLFIDGYLLLKLSGISSKTPYYLLNGISVGSVIIFNLTDIILHDPALWVPLTSLLMFLILLVPSIFLMFASGASKFTRVVGLFYIVLLLVMLPRFLYSFTVESVYIFTNNFIQSLTFLSLTLNMIFSAPALLLVMKENTDKIIEKMAATDGLTNLHNRQSFMSEAQGLFERYKISDSEVTLLFFDIDFFKKVNDNYGHSFGDKVLIKFAEVIKSNMRSNDLSCRYGGEEFVALLPGCGEENGLLVGERIMKQVSELYFEPYSDFKFTISIGIYTGNPSGKDTLLAFINKSDSALYEAKNTGRNKIVVYHDSQ